MFSDVLKGLDKDPILVLVRELLERAEKKGISIQAVEEAKPGAYKIWGDYISLDTFWEVLGEYSDPHGYIQTDQAVEIMDYCDEDLGNRPEEWRDIINSGIINFLEDQNLRLCDACQIVILRRGSGVFCDDCIRDIRRR